MDANRTYDFQLGRIGCTSMSDGRMIYGPPTFPPPAELLFTNAPKDRLGTVLAEFDTDPEQWSDWVNPCTCLLVNTGDHRVLIDTGAAGLGPDTGKLPQSLGAAGVAAEEIDLIVITHGHFDHIGGNTDAEGKVLFPNAQWIMSETEWQFWMEGEAERVLPDDAFGGVKAVLLGFAQKNLGPIRDKVRLVQRREEIVPGVEVVPTPGHTPGHLSVVVSSGDERLFCLGDVCLHEAHVSAPDWVAAFDMVPSLVAATRRAILTEASEANARAMAFHFPFPGVGRLSRSGDGWRWLSEG